MNIVEKPSTAPVWKLASPCEFGPTRRMPDARAAASIRSCRRRPSTSPVSPKPEDMITAPATPRPAAVSTACAAASPGTATRTTSGTSGRSASPGTAGKPWTRSRPGFTGSTLPAKPCSRR